MGKFAVAAGSGASGCGRCVFFFLPFLSISTLHTVILLSFSLLSSVNC